MHNFINSSAISSKPGMYDSMTPTRLIYLFHIDLKSTFKSYTVMKFIGAKLAVLTHIKGWMNTMALGASSCKIKIVFSKYPVFHHSAPSIPITPLLIG